MRDDGGAGMSLQEICEKIFLINLKSYLDLIMYILNSLN